MKTNVKRLGMLKNDWLLKLSRKVDGGSYKFQYISCWDMTEEEVLAVADSYSSCDTVVRVYNLETVLKS